MGRAILDLTGGHKLELEPNGDVILDGVALDASLWRKIAEVVHGHHVRLGQAPDTSHRQPRSLLRAAPLWIRIATFGRVADLPAGPSLRGIRRY